jgi:hemoglobin/transferrin/lactoferrin receptor protein
MPAAVLVLTAAAGSATAQSAPGDSAARGIADRRRIADTVTVLPPVQVREQRPAARRAATTVRLERAGVVRFLPVSTGDALLAVPGVDLVKTGPWASRVSLRGLAGDRVLLMVDGVRLNTVRGHGVQASLISPDRLDAVELMPGASSTEFGSDAMGGVVHLITHRSLFADHPATSLSLSARGAEPGRQLAQQTRLTLVSPRFGLDLSGGLGWLEALTTPEGRIPNSGDRERNLAARGAARLGGAVIDYEHTHAAALDVGLPAFNGASGASAVYPLQSRDADRLEVALPGRGPLHEARVLGVVQSFRTHFTETTADSSFLRGRFIALKRTAAADRVRTRVASLQPSFRFAIWGSPLLTFEARSERAGGPRATEVTVFNAGGAVTSHETGIGESVPPARRDVWSATLFGNGSWRAYRLESGLRWEALRSRADRTEDGATRLDRKLSGDGGLACSVGPIEPYAHVSSGFRAPNLDERFFDDDVHGGLRLFGNPDLRSERALSLEAGARTRETLGGRLLGARVSAYRSEVRDLITFRYIGQLYRIPYFQYANVRRARIEGMEYAATARAGAVLVALNVAFPRGFDLETGERLSDIGAGRATLDMTVPLGGALPQATVAARLRWNDAVWTRDTTLHRPRFATVAVEGSCVLGGVRAVLAVRNLLDASYREPLSFIPEPGRTFAISLRRDFGVPLKLWGRDS